MAKDIKVIDNFLSSFDFNNIKSLLFSSTLDWYYSDHICDENEKGLHNCMFTHSFFRLQPEVNLNNNFNLIIPIIKKLKICSLLRIKANLTLRTSEPIKHCFHTDHHESYYKSAILYINNNNGGTEFEDGTFIESKENRLLICKSNIKHTGVSQTNTKERIVLSLIYT